jgi:CheY-like chemotaxis protein
MSLPNPNHSIEILLVEDNLGDVELTTLALEESKLSVHLSVVGDGAEALDFLHHQKQKYINSPHPDLILLDLNLPKKSGHEVLAAIKNEEALKRIPVVVLTTSQAEEDILKAYNLYASGYIAKPTRFDQFLSVVQAIEDFWFATVRLPPE